MNATIGSVRPVVIEEQQAKPMRRRLCALGVGVLLSAVAASGAAQPLSWSTIVNNGDTIPGTEAAPMLFNSYNQPSLNESKLVVFRARGKGGAGGEPVHGIYMRDMSGANPIVKITARGDTVPAPNNTLYSDLLASFSEYPSTPRIDIASPLIATRGQSQPVWTYQLLDETVVPPVLTDTRVGTSGIYANPGGVLLTGASLLGAVVDVDQTTLTFPWFSVPGAPPGTRFDQFPGSPAVTGGQYIAFKGNYTDPSDGLGRTGVYYRDVTPVAPPAVPPSIQLVANSNMVIPNQPPGGTVLFGSTAPPSAANGFMVFTGLDVEDAPTLGGIYRAPLQPTPALQTLVAIGDPVPGERSGATFRAFGEGLSISADGRFISFWGAWGTQTTTRTLVCPSDGNKDLIAYCNDHFPNGYVVNIPVHQGIFVHDAQDGLTLPVAKTGEDGFSDFLYWVFSGRPPGTGGGDEPTLEPPRWRASAFTALSATHGNSIQTAFKGTKSAVSPASPLHPRGAAIAYDGIYVRNGFDAHTPLLTVVETVVGSGQAIDPMAPANSIITAIGIERDGFRNGHLAVAVSMLYEDALTSVGWAGLYLAHIPPVPDVPAFTSAASRRNHGGKGPFELALALSPSNPTTEPRMGPDHTIVFTFDHPVSSATADVTEGIATISGMSASGNTLLVNLGGVADRQYVTVRVSNVVTADGSLPGVAGSVRIGMLAGDVNQSRVVTLADLGLVNAAQTQPLTAANFHLDVNANGALTVSEKAIVNANLTHALPAP